MCYRQNENIDQTTIKTEISFNLTSNQKADMALTFPFLHCVLSLIQLLVCNSRRWLKGKTFYLSLNLKAPNVITQADKSKSNHGIEGHGGNAQPHGSSGAVHSKSVYNQWEHVKERGSGTEWVHNSPLSSAFTWTLLLVVQRSSYPPQW